MYRKHFKIYVSGLVFRKYRGRPAAVCDRITKGGGVDFERGGLTPPRNYAVLQRQNCLDSIAGAVLLPRQYMSMFGTVPGFCSEQFRT